MIRNSVQGTRRSFSVLSSLKATEAKSTEGKSSKNGKDVKYQNLSEAQKAYLSRAIRVDQAGELGADYIYAGQYFILANKYPHLKPVLKHMWDQEIHHHSTFNNYQLKNRVRPSLFTPMWKVGAFAMGAGTALISPRAAMACTEAVETVIGGHYNEQLRCLNSQFNLDSSDNTTVGQPEEIKALIANVAQFRDDELEHLNTALQHDSKLAVPYWLLTEGIKAICRVAIWSAERI